MTLGLHNLKTAAGSKRSSRRVGRGNSSGRGSYSSRGQKGQRARSGGKGGLKRRGLMQMLKSKPKLGGFTSPYKPYQSVNIDVLEKQFAAGEQITAKKLLDKGLIATVTPGLKVLGQGTLTKKFEVLADRFSESAKKAIEAAGGTAVVRKKPVAKKTVKKAKTTKR